MSLQPMLHLTRGQRPQIRFLLHTKSKTPQILRLSYHLRKKGGIFIPNLTTPSPPPVKAEDGHAVKALREWGAALIDELTYLLANLDSGNVKSAGSVKAENIDTSTARISNAQIGVLNASKLIAGTIDTNRVTVSSADGNLQMSGTALAITDKNGNPLFYAGYDTEHNRFDFHLYGKGGKGIYLNNDGNAVFSGMLSSSDIYASKIIGTSRSEFLSPTVGHSFVQIDRAGIKLVRARPGQEHQQKFGATIASDGSMVAALGEGEGDPAFYENGVAYRPGSFVLKKNANDTAEIGLCAQNSQIEFENGKINVTAENVTVNGKELATKAELDELRKLLPSQPNNT